MDKIPKNNRRAPYWRPPVVVKKLSCVVCDEFSVPNRQGGVVVSQIAVPSQGYPSGAAAAIPAQGAVAVGEGQSVQSAQAVVNPVVAVAVAVRAVEDELSVDQSVHVVVAQHHISPVEAQQRHVPQVDDVVCIAVDLVAVVVEIVERSVKERSKSDAQDAVDNWSGGIGVPTGGNHGAIPCERCGTVGTGGRRQRTTPVVVSVIPVEVVAIVVVAVVKAVVGIVAAATRLVVARLAARPTVAARTVAAIVGLAAIVSGIDITGLAVAAIARLAVAAIAGLAAVTRLAVAAIAGLAFGPGRDAGGSVANLVLGQVCLVAGRADRCARVGAGGHGSGRGCAAAVAAAHGCSTATAAAGGRVAGAGVTAAAVDLRTSSGAVTGAAGGAAAVDLRCG